MVVKRMKPYVNLVHKHSNHLERLLSNEKLTDAYNEERILLIRKLGYPMGGEVVRSRQLFHSKENIRHEREKSRVGDQGKEESGQQHL